MFRQFDVFDDDTVDVATVQLGTEQLPVTAPQGLNHFDMLDAFCGNGIGDLLQDSRGDLHLQNVEIKTRKLTRIGGV